MKAFSSLLCGLLLAVCAAGCWVPELPDDTVFSCDTDADCAEDGVVCLPRAGQSGYCCKPVAETCNGRDDDCDGQTDNLAEEPCYGGPPGTLGKGVCKAGKPTCDATTVVCSGDVQPGTEVCNGLDDDCDGQVDEGFNLQTDMANCGRCGNACNAATELCVDGSCRQFQETSCGNGQDDDRDGLTDCADSDCNGLSCNTRGGCVCQGGKATETVCSDNTDNDGDGLKDCADSDCNGQACGISCICQNGQVRETNCTDGVDNDGDGKPDCADSDCLGLACHKSGGTGTCQSNGACL
ncbi:MAG: MopE-related protein [Archangium sp.]